MPDVRHEDGFEFSGGSLCLDFVNTLGDRPRAQNESLHGATDLLRWGVAAQVLSASACKRPGNAAARFEAAIALRECLFRIFAARIAAAAPAESDLDLLNEHLRAAMGRLELRAAGAGFAWEIAGKLEPADLLIASIARSAGELLTSPELDRVRECGSGTCSWLFVDRSRTKRRRWCDMKTCGNRAKARRHYRKQKARAKRSK